MIYTYILDLILIYLPAQIHICPIYEIFNFSILQFIFIDI